ncbi:MAG: HIT domain-containing protein [Rickettsiales bacterium]|nr:HIT domain-containing protein [Rickettsiales bacterium]
MNKLYNPDNIFAKIIRKEIPADIIFEDDLTLVFKDILPASPIHYLVIPKGEYVSYSDFISKASDEIIIDFFKRVNDIASKYGFDGGFRLITNDGPDANQTVEHFHVHILGGKEMGGLLTDDKLKR